MPGRTRPIEKFAEASAKCAAEVSSFAIEMAERPNEAYFLQGALYGKCIAASYQNVAKDMCAREFMALKECYLVSFNVCKADQD